MGDELPKGTQFKLSDIPDDVKDLKIQDLNSLLGDNKVLAGLRDSLAPAKARSNAYTERANANLEISQNIMQLRKSQSLLEQDIIDLKSQEVDTFARWQQIESKMYIESRPYTRLGIEELLRAKINDCETRKQELTVKMRDSNVSQNETAGLVRVYADTMCDLHYYQSVLNSI